MGHRRKQALRPQHADTDDIDIPLWWYMIPLFLGMFFGYWMHISGELRRMKKCRFCSVGYVWG